MRLVLLGCVHLDPDGARRLSWWLDRLRPDAITVEVSRYALAFRRRHGPRLLGRMYRNLEQLAREESARTGTDVSALVSMWSADDRVAAIERQIGIPYEYESSAAWGEAHDVPVNPVDLSSLSALFLSRLETEVIEPENLRTLLDGLPRMLRAEVAALYARTRLNLAFPRPAVALASGETERDEIVAAQIREVAAEGGSLLVHVCGAGHLLNYPESLRERLADLSPEPILLDEKGNA